MKVLVRILVSVALMYFVLRSIDLAALWLRVKGMNPAWIVLALLSYVFIQAVKALLEKPAEEGESPVDETGRSWSGS